MSKNNKNYIKELTRFNIKLHISEKQVFEKYAPGVKIAEGEIHYLYAKLLDKNIQGKFAYNPKINELCFVPLEGVNQPAIYFVDYVALNQNLSYTGALKQIRKDFNLKLNVVASTELEDQSQDFRYAADNGIFENTFNPTIQVPKEKQEGKIFLAGIELCGVGGICMLIGQPGAGKSNVSEILCAKFCNPAVDGLGFTFNQLTTDKILYVDMERSERHLYNGWNRLITKSRLSKEDVIKKTTFLGYKSVANRLQMISRLNKLERDIFVNRPSIVIIDGVSKMIDDINNLNECVEFIRWLSNMAEEYNLSLVVTIHANPSDMKAQGHLGSVLMREAESVLAVKYDKTKGNTQRMLTTDFQHGKVRGDSDKVESCFDWSQEHNGFVSAEKKAATEKNSIDEVKKNVQKAFEGKEFMSYKQLAGAMSTLTGNSYETERKKIGRYVEQEFIVLNNSFYYLPVSVKNV